MSQSNGHGPAAPPQLLKLLAKHERIVASIRETLNALGVHQTQSSTTRASSTLATALALDEERVAGSGRKKPQWRTSPAVEKRRRQTLAVLSKFNHDTPTPPPPDPTGKNRTIGSLVRYGYLKPKGDGFVRTSKEFTEKKS